MNSQRIEDWLWESIFVYGLSKHCQQFPPDVV
jgi:hypothetical protein